MYCSLGDCREGFASETGCEYGVEERVGARVDGVEEDEQYFWLGDVDERIAEQCGEAEEDDGRGAREVGADQDGYFAGHWSLPFGSVTGLVAQWHVDLHVTEQHQQERGRPERQQCEHVAHAARACGVHRQADAVLGKTMTLMIL